MKGMSNEPHLFEVVKRGIGESIDLLTEGELDEINGGDVECKKGFSASKEVIICACGYKLTPETM